MSRVLIPPTSSLWVQTFLPRYIWLPSRLCLFVFVFLCDSSSASFPPSSRWAPTMGKALADQGLFFSHFPPLTRSPIAPVGPPERTAHVFSFFLWSDTPVFVHSFIDSVALHESNTLWTCCRTWRKTPDCYIRVTKAQSRKFHDLLLMLYFLLESGLLRGPQFRILSHQLLWSMWLFNHWQKWGYLREPLKAALNPQVVGGEKRLTDVPACHVLVKALHEPLLQPCQIDSLGIHSSGRPNNSQFWQEATTRDVSLSVGFKQRAKHAVWIKDDGFYSFVPNY